MFRSHDILEEDSDFDNFGDLEDGTPTPNIRASATSLPAQQSNVEQPKQPSEGAEVDSGEFVQVAKKKRTRIDKHPRTIIQNPFGRAGYKRCVNCRRRRQKCVYEDPELPCNLCKQRGWSCGVQEKILPANAQSTDGSRRGPPATAQGQFMVSVMKLPLTPSRMQLTEMESNSISWHLPFNRCPSRGPHFLHFSSEETHIQHLLAFHRASIVAGHYFWFFDPHQFCTILLLRMAEQSISLRYAVAAFASLVYSVYADRNAREFAFIYYAEAVRSLQRELNSTSRNRKYQHFAILATALQLATVERFIADSAKCFRHLQGAAQILQYLSDPLQQSSTTLGRCLLEWYFNLEDHCSLVLAHKHLLHNTWREEMLRIRRELSGIEYVLLPEDQRLPRLLDDTWQETWEIVPHCAKVLVTIPQLKHLQGERLVQTLRSVEKDLVYSWTRLNELTGLLCESKALDVIDIDAFTSRHSRCCPLLPFQPYLFQYPPAGLLQLMILSMRNYIATILYAPLRDAGSRIELLENNCDKKSVEQHALEMCRTFAALEHAYIDEPCVLLPSFSALVIVGFTALEELRLWIWHKFVHFEQSGAPYVNPIKKNLSVLWNMPELVSQDRYLGRRSVVDIDVIEIKRQPPI